MTMNKKPQNYDFSKLNFCSAFSPEKISEYHNACSFQYPLEISLPLQMVIKNSEKSPTQP